MSKALRNQRMLIITHVYGTGPPQDLATYLVSRVRSLTVISHPLPDAPDQHSVWRRYHCGQQVASGHGSAWGGAEVIRYIKDFVRSLSWAYRHAGVSDLAVCAGGINAVCGLILKLTGRVRQVVFYCIDWVPNRFPNPILNRIYHLFDRLAVTFADQTWNLSARMEAARQQHGYGDTGKQITVPVGIWFQRFPKQRKSHSQPGTIVFMGHLRPGQGLPLLFDAFSIIHQRIPDAHLSIVGSGLLEPELKARAQSQHLESLVTFHGFIPNHRELERLLVEGDIAVAPYEPGAFTFYTDPGKLKVYLAAGLPVVLTDVVGSAAQIAQAGAGQIISYEKQALAKAIITILENPQLQANMRAQALKLAAQYDWKHIFPAALQKILPN